MPLGVREVLLIMRAKDEASRVIAGIGSQFGTVSAKSKAAGGAMVSSGLAVAGVGAAMSAAGAVGLSFFNDMTNAAMEYRQESALTLTQIDKQKTSLADIEQIGLRVAKAIPAPLEQLQPALYDIFSSMDVGLKGAEALLTGFAKAAVAGQTDVQTAGRATIAIMNAYQLPVSRLNDVLDFQFQ